MSEILNIQMESDLSEWTSTVTDGGDLSQAAGAALGGTSGGMPRSCGLARAAPAGCFGF